LKCARLTHAGKRKGEKFSQMRYEEESVAVFIYEITWGWPSERVSVDGGLVLERSSTVNTAVSIPLPHTKLDSMMHGGGQRERRAPKE
jgi:hypothetical protein